MKEHYNPGLINDFNHCIQGGIRGTVWGSVFQGLIMFGGVLLVCIGVSHYSFQIQLSKWFGKKYLYLYQA